ncbi:MAG: DinB family protein [Bacteroidetes bacterium]|nr:DinB family protein [Bacteroidota bacterium]
MKFDINKSIQILERTPSVIEEFLTGLDDEWLCSNEGADTWSPFDVIGHLIEGEKTDWIPRMQIILSKSPDKKFVPFDRFKQFNDNKSKAISELLLEFHQLRRDNIEILKSTTIDEHTLGMTGIHPEFGHITLKQLLATWVTHDLAHILQISRVMAKQYKEEIGPWTKYFSVFAK